MNAIAILPLVLASLPASKLGPHVLGAPTEQATQEILAACPRVSKWISARGEVAGAISAWRTRCPDSQVVLRIDVGDFGPYDVSQSPEQAADDFWGHMLGGLAGIDAPGAWLEGPGGLEGLPDWSRDPVAAQWIADFWSRLADLVFEAGYTPLVGSIPMGAPLLAGELGPDSPNLFAAVAEAMEAKPYRWGWSYQAYSRNLSANLAIEATESLRYRLIRDECGLDGIPIVLSEGGQAAPGWQAQGTSEEAYLEWLGWLDSELSKDKEVVGIALFQVGDRGTAAGFDLSPIASELARHIATFSPDAGTESPDAGGPEGRDVASVSPGPPATGEYQSDWNDSGCGCGSAASPALGSSALALLFIGLARRSKKQAL